MQIGKTRNKNFRKKLTVNMKVEFTVFKYKRGGPEMNHLLLY